MNVQLVQFSTVVVGQSHNPTLLNPDFLRIRNIVPESWGWELAPTPITTPPFAQVRYTNGVSITVEPTKLQVVDLRAGDDPTTSKAPEIVKAYVETLPHVRYTGVGVMRRVSLSRMKIRYFLGGAAGTEVAKPWCRESEG